jgi:glycosyltransferase involved in cell wall biosynthesis
MGTLHHMPQNKIKMLFLKLWSNRLDCIIVHSEYIKEQLLLEGIKNVKVIDYPSFYDYSQYPSKEVIRKNLNIPDEKVVISALGGTRFDKGLDILLESFRFLNSKDKNKILLNIVGREETFKKEFILEKIQQYEINARIELGFVNDDDFVKNILISDYIVLPYRKIFTGNSGPMTEAIVNKIPIISPEYGNLGYLSQKYNLGETFNNEDSNSLAMALMRSTQKNEYNNRDYRERLNVPSFVTGYEKIYKELNQNV